MRDCRLIGRSTENQLDSVWLIDWLVDQLTDSPMVHSIQRKIFHLIITFSSSKSWSSCMLDAPEKSQPNRFWNKKNEKARTMIVKWLYNLLSLALYFPNIGKSTKIGNWACCKRGTKKKNPDSSTGFEPMIAWTPSGRPIRWAMERSDHARNMLIITYSSSELKIHHLFLSTSKSLFFFAAF